MLRDVDFVEKTEVMNNLKDKAKQKAI
jgi:hypothetical protein